MKNQKKTGGKMTKNGNFVIVSGRGNPELVKKIGNLVGVNPVIMDTENFSNGYPRAEAEEKDQGVNYAGKKVIIITNLQYRKIGSPLEELKLIADTCAKANEIHLILTYMCGKNDTSHKPKSATTLAYFADQIKKIHKLVSVSWYDPHSSVQIEFFYPIHDRARFYFLKDILEKMKEIAIDQVAATDFGAGKRAYVVRKILGLENIPILFAEKDHAHNNQKKEAITHQKVIGLLQGKKLLLADDMGLTMGTMCGSARNIRKMKGGDQIEIIGAVAQFDPAGKAYKNLKKTLADGTLTDFYTTNSNPIDKKFLEMPNFHVIDISRTVAELVKIIVDNKLSNRLFKDF